MARPRLGMLAGKRARSGPTSPFLRFVRDHVDVLEKFDFYSTGGTAQSISNTGLYDEPRIHFLLSGSRGGVVQLAAQVARGECVAVIFLSDPRDLWADAAENRALKRVCIEQKVRLVTSQRGAEEWALYEADDASREAPSNRTEWKPGNWRPGISNADQLTPIDLNINQTTLALISHDAMKAEMASFVEENIEKLAEFDRILATGTTGWFLRLRHAEANDQRDFEEEAKQRIGPERLGMILKDIGELGHASPSPEFTDRLMPLASGPKGGDVLIANEIIEHKCHIIIFFYDSATAHPHEPDIRLLERSAQIPWIFASCVSDPVSANKWAKGLEKRGA